MTTLSERWPGRWPAGAERIFSREQVASALDTQAERLQQRLAGQGRLTLMALMNGGMYPAVELARRLELPMQIDHLHASRYRGQTRGGELHWGRWPSRVEGAILLVDDIFDEGHTLKAVRDRLLQDGAELVVSAVLTVKQHQRGLARDWVDDAALIVPDRYVFGCGMDWHGYWRQLDDIWALPEDAA